MVRSFDSWKHFRWFTSPLKRWKHLGQTARNRISTIVDAVIVRRFVSHRDPDKSAIVSSFSLRFHDRDNFESSLSLVTKKSWFIRTIEIPRYFRLVLLPDCFLTSLRMAVFVINYSKLCEQMLSGRYQFITRMVSITIFQQVGESVLLYFYFSIDGAARNNLGKQFLR